jgi:hypothetical protein
LEKDSSGTEIVANPGGYNMKTFLLTEKNTAFQFPGAATQIITTE